MRLNEVLKSSSVGLVLSGGGAKGAFQAGVWKAMCEVGIADRVRVISGTSVGAINAVAFAMLRNADLVRDLWLNHVDEIVSPNFDALSLEKVVPMIWDVISGKPFPFLGLLSRPGLISLLQQVVTRTLERMGIDVYATALACKGSVVQTFDPSGYSLTRFHLNDEISADRIRRKVLASASIPWGFDPVDIDGVRYIDGAYESNGGDNVPIAPIVENYPDIKRIYVVRCNSRQVEPFRYFTMPGRQIVEIFPQQTLPGVLDKFNLDGNPTFKSLSGVMSFKAEYARRYFDAGYADGLAALRNPILDAKLNW